MSIFFTQNVSLFIGSTSSHSSTSGSNTQKHHKQRLASHSSGHSANTSDVSNTAVNETEAAGSKPSTSVASNSLEVKSIAFIGNELWTCYDMYTVIWVKTKWLPQTNLEHWMLDVHATLNETHNHLASKINEIEKGPFSNLSIWFLLQSTSSSMMPNFNAGNSNSNNNLNNSGNNNNNNNSSNASSLSLNIKVNSSEAHSSVSIFSPQNKTNIKLFRCLQNTPDRGLNCDTNDDDDRNSYSGYNSGDEHHGQKYDLTPAEWEERDKLFVKTMSDRGFVIEAIAEDGACLFRAISLQICGDQEMHEMIRQQTMDYIVSICGWQ